jgi:aspartyl-tRNA(Asn)/glutamyl-tRNA(Gln) amidotransferase subunit C
MSVQIDESLVRRIARLSRLALDDGEVALFTRQLGDVLRYVEQLETLETAADDPPNPAAGPARVCPSADARPTSANTWRDDQPGCCLTPEQALANAPQSRNGCFITPATLDQTSGA